MTLIRILRNSLLGAGIALTAATAAFAHHGWAWTEDGFFELEGVIAAIYFGNPHATLNVDVNGEIWKVELAPPRQTTNAGFTGSSASVGDEVVVIGNRSRDETEPLLKAVRVNVNGETYDIYPRRVPSN